MIILVALALRMLAVAETTVVLGTIERDLTADGKPEILSLVGVGKTAGSMSVTLTIRSDDRVVYRASVCIENAVVFSFSRGGDDAGAIAWSTRDLRFYRFVECC